MEHSLIYTASILIGIWGTAHLFATKGVIAGFGSLSEDNRLIITMEWIVEGVSLLAIAAFVTAVTVFQPETMAAQAVYGVAVMTLFTLALVSLLTGFKVSFVVFKLCPVIFCVSAILIICGAWL